MTANPPSISFWSREFDFHVNFMPMAHKVATLCHTNGPLSWIHIQWNLRNGWGWYLLISIFWLFNRFWSGGTTCGNRVGRELVETERVRSSPLYLSLSCREKNGNFASRTSIWSRMSKNLNMRITMDQIRLGRSPTSCVSLVLMFGHNRQS